VGRKWTVVAAIVCGAILVVALYPRRHEVLVATADEGPLTLRITASGLVETESADVSFRASGEIVGLYADEGQSVSASAVLARLRAAPQVTAPSGVSGRASGPSGDYEVIQAPYDCVIVDVYHRKGSVVQPGVPVLRVASSEAPWVTAFIDAEDAAYLGPGDPMRCRAGGYLSEPWDITVESVGREAVPRRDLPGSARQVRVRCRPSSSAIGLAPGTEVDVDAEVTLAGSAVRIPAAAVTHDGPMDVVYVVERGAAHRREVRVGPNNFELIQIREGVSVGETVVVRGKERLRDGMRVAARPLPRRPSAMGDD